MLNRKKRSKLSRIFCWLILIGLTAVFVFSGFGGCEKRKKQKVSDDEIRIVIFHINDIHGQINSFVKISSLIKLEKKKNSNVFFICSGDNFSGNPYVDQYIPKGEPILELLNYLGCDVQVLGNHEFDYGQEILKKYILRANFKVICANINTTQSKIPQPPPFVILKTKEGIRIAILGILQISKETGQPDCHPDRLNGLIFSDEIKTAKKYGYLKEENDIFIALTHLGFYKDEILAKVMGELDVIVGGHSHTVIEKPRETNGVLIAQTGSKNKYLGKIELVLKDKKLVEKKGELIALDLIKSEDQDVKQMIKKYENNPQLNQVICRLPAPLRSKSDLGNLITDAICDILHLELAFYNSGGIRMNRLSQEVRIKDVYAIHPFGNEIIIYNLFPAEIRSLIRFDYEHIGPLDLQVSGLEYTVIANREKKTSSIELKDKNGNRLDENKTYSVGLNNYVASVYKFDHQDPGRSSHLKMADILIMYLKKGVDIKNIIGIKRVHKSIVN